MTWKEFKEWVDKELIKRGKDENIKIAFFDIFYPTIQEDGSINVELVCAGNKLEIYRYDN